MSEFGKRLREQRKKRHMTQETLARRSGLLAMNICHYECGRRLPKLPAFIALVQALGCTADYLIGNDKPSATPLSPWYPEG